MITVYFSYDKRKTGQEAAEMVLICDVFVDGVYKQEYVLEGDKRNNIMKRLNTKYRETKGSGLEFGLGLPPGMVFGSSRLSVDNLIRDALEREVKGQVSYHL